MTVNQTRCVCCKTNRRKNPRDSKTKFCKNCADYIHHRDMRFNSKHYKMIQYIYNHLKELKGKKG